MYNTYKCYLGFFSYITLRNKKQSLHHGILTLHKQYSEASVSHRSFEGGFLISEYLVGTGEREADCHQAKFSPIYTMPDTGTPTTII